LEASKSWSPSHQVQGSGSWEQEGPIAGQDRERKRKGVKKVKRRQTDTISFLTKNCPHSQHINLFIYKISSNCKKASCHVFLFISTTNRIGDVCTCMVAPSCIETLGALNFRLSSSAFSWPASLSNHI
jgi:hypothetical protein